MAIRLSEHQSYFIHFTESEENLSVNNEGLTLMMSDKILFANVQSKIFNTSVMLIVN